MATTDRAGSYPRSYVPTDADLGSWDEVEPLLEGLLAREIRSPSELETWLLDHSELSACISEERSRRYIAMTCDTGDEEKERRYLEFIESILPRCKPYFHSLNEKYVASPDRNGLDRERYAVLDREIEAAIEIFREQNVPLQTEAAKLSQKYQKVCGAMTVRFDGEERTLPQMARYLEDIDRAVRRQAWEKVWRRRLEDRDSLDEIFDRLVELRSQIARNADFDDYRGYAFKAMGRFDYTIEDSERFQATVAELVVPISRTLNRQRLERLRRADPALDELRPWDLHVDPEGRPPLRPFETTDQLVEGVQNIFRKVDPELADLFAEMRGRGELDLESRKGKAPGGYLSTLDEVRRPFIFMNAVGLQHDVETLLHESGHAFHSLATRDEPLVGYRHAPIEFAEVASMTMELFAAAELGVFYAPKEAARAKRQHLEKIIGLLPWVAQIDAFQHWLYAHPGHDRGQRTRAWLRIDERFGPEVEWSGYEEIRQASWQRQLHLFVHPFYYIEYGIAQLGALQVWLRFREEPRAAVADYRAALALGGARPLPELFSAAGARFDFSAATIEPLVEAIQDELSRLPV